MSDNTNKDDEPASIVKDILRDIAEEYNLGGNGVDLDVAIERIRRYGIQERIDAHREGYRRGVDDFSGYYMDASIPTQRNLIMPHIAVELIENYRPPVYTRLTALKDTDSDLGQRHQAKSHSPSCPINWPPTPSGAGWCCSCQHTGPVYKSVNQKEVK